VTKKVKIVALVSGLAVVGIIAGVVVALTGGSGVNVNSPGYEQGYQAGLSFANQDGSSRSLCNAGWNGTAVMAISNGSGPAPAGFQAGYMAGCLSVSPDAPAPKAHPSTAQPTTASGNYYYADGYTAALKATSSALKAAKQKYGYGSPDADWCEQNDPSPGASIDNSTSPALGTPWYKGCLAVLKAHENS
jgi:hypothetical protein